MDTKILIAIALVALYIAYKLMANKNEKEKEKKDPYQAINGDDDVDVDELIDDEEENEDDGEKEDQTAETEDGNPFLPEEPCYPSPETITKIVFGWKKDYPHIVESIEPIIGLQGESKKIETYTELADADNITMYILSDYEMYVGDTGIEFGNFANVKTIEFQNFNTQYAETMCSMFENCEKLEKVDLSGFDTSNVEDISDMFCDCKSLKEVNLRGINTKKVIYFDGLFSGCESLESIDLSGFDTSNGEVFSFMFEECRKLRTLDLSSFDTKKSWNMTNMFKDCDNLETIYASDTFEAKANEEKDMEDPVFENCPKLCATDIDGNKFSFDESKINYHYARIFDRIKGEEGYFTMR